jgi:hypothetical protein
MTSFKYECLKSQITIRGVYIKGYAAGGWEDYELPEGAGFCVAIQDWLEARSQVVLAGEAQSPNGSCKLFDVVTGIWFFYRAWYLTQCQVEFRKRCMIQPKLCTLFFDT